MAHTLPQPSCSGETIDASAESLDRPRAPSDHGAAGHGPAQGDNHHHRQQRHDRLAALRHARGRIQRRGLRPGRSSISADRGRVRVRGPDRRRSHPARPGARPVRVRPTPRVGDSPGGLLRLLRRAEPALRGDHGARHGAIAPGAPRDAVRRRAVHLQQHDARSCAWPARRADLRGVTGWAEMGLSALEGRDGKGDQGGARRHPVGDPADRRRLR